MGLAIILVAGILILSIGLILIYQKLDKQEIKLPEVNVTVKLDQPIQQDYSQSTKIINDTSKDWQINPLEYIKNTETKAHIQWDDSQHHKDRGSTTI